MQMTGEPMDDSYNSMGNIKLTKISKTAKKGKSANPYRKLIAHTNSCLCICMKMLRFISFFLAMDK